MSGGERNAEDGFPVEPDMTDEAGRAARVGLQRFSAWIERSVIVGLSPVTGLSGSQP